MSTLNRILITARAMAEPALSALAALVAEQQTQHWAQHRDRGENDYELRAHLQLQGVSEEPLTFTHLLLTLHELNEAELHLVGLYVNARLQGRELPDGTETTFGRDSRIKREGAMVPLSNVKLPLPDAVSTVVAFGAENEHERQQVLALFDQAIARQQAADQPSFTLRMWREWYRLGPQLVWSALIPFYQEALAFHKQRKDWLKQVDTLKQLASATARTGDKPQAIVYLDEAERLLMALTPSEVARMTQQTGLSAERFMQRLLQMQLESVQQMRSQFVDR